MTFRDQGFSSHILAILSKGLYLVNKNEVDKPG